MEKIQVCIVEDQDLIRKSLQVILNMEEDIEVIDTAANGQEILGKLENVQPDIILMDIHMPIMNGVEATKIIKEKWPDIKVIILTTFEEVHYVIDALNGGAVGYLLKAIDPKDLTAGIRLVYRGETLIPQGLAKILFSSHIQMNSRQSNDLNVKQKFSLSSRELELLKLVSLGLNNREIAERIFLSEGTVKNYISSIYSKLDVGNRTAAMMKAKEEGLLS